MTRKLLPNRRPHELVSFVFRDRRYVAGVGRFADGSLAELFIDAEKQSTDDARDAAVTLSLASQYGAPVATLRAAVTRDASGRPAGIVGFALDILAESDR